MAVLAIPDTPGLYCAYQPLPIGTPQFSLYISDSKGSGISDGNPVRFRHSKHRHFYHKLYKNQYVLDAFLCAVYDKISTLSVAGSKGFRFLVHKGDYYT